MSAISIKKNKFPIGTYALWFLTGVFALSYIGTLLFERLPIPYLPEIFLIPIICLHRKSIKTKPIKQGLSLFFIGILLVEILSLLFGILNTRGDVFNVISCGRPLVYITLLSYFFSRNNTREIPLRLLFFLCLGGQVGELIAKLINPAFSSVNSIDHINWLTFSVIIFIPAITKNNKILILAIMLGLINAILSFYRRIMVFYFLTILIVIVYKLFSTKKLNKFVFIFITGCTLFLFFRFYEDILAFILNALKVDYSLFEARFVDKFRSLFEGRVNPSDRVRYDSYDNIIANFNNDIVPKGPIGKSVDIISYFGLYTDTPISFLIDFFGSYFAVLLVFILSLLGVSCFVRVLFHSEKYNKTFILCSLMAPLLITSLFDDGAFLVHLNYALVTGYCLSGLFFSKRKKSALTNYGRL